MAALQWSLFFVIIAQKENLVRTFDDKPPHAHNTQYVYRKRLDRGVPQMYFFNSHWNRIVRACVYYKYVAGFYGFTTTTYCTREREEDIFNIYKSVNKNIKTNEVVVHTNHLKTKTFLFTSPFLLLLVCSSSTNLRLVTSSSFSLSLSLSTLSLNYYIIRI